MIKFECDRCGAEETYKKQETLCGACKSDYQLKLDALDRKHEKAVQAVEKDFYPTVEAVHKHEFSQGYIMRERGKATKTQVCKSDHACRETVVEVINA